MATLLKNKNEELDIVQGNTTQSSGQAWYAFNDADQRSREAEKNNPAFQSSKHLAKINGVLDVLKKHSGKNQLFELYDYYKNSRERGFTVIKTIFGFDRRTYNNQKMVSDLAQFGAELKNGVPCKKPGHLNLLIHIKL